jgi:tetratricopeptide (TPR) repeat protein
MVTLERERNPAYLDGAAGLLLDPSTLGALLLLALPASVFIVWLRRFPGPVRLLNGFLILALFIGFILSTHRPGLGVLVGVGVLLPFFLSKFWAVRRQLWTRGLLVLLVALPAFWFATDALRIRLLGFWNYSADPLEAASLTVAWSRFLENPLFGNGLGSFAYLWEMVAPNGIGGTALYPASAYLDLLSAMGLVGFLLVLVPVLVLMVRGLMIWRGVPFVTVNKDVAERMKRFPRGHPGRARLERTQGRAPSSKIILGGLIFGLGGFLVYVGWDYSLRLPVHLFMAACLFAALAVFSRKTRRAKVSQALGLATGLIPLLLAAWAFSFGVPRFYAQYLVYTTDEQLEYLLSDPDRIFIDPGVVTPLILSYQSATELDPKHAGAWLGTGRAWLARLYADLWPADELAAEAQPAFEKALELAPLSWLAHYEAARALALLDRGEAVDLHLRRALELAPNRAEPKALLGSLLLLRDRASSEGRDLLEAALTMNPGYEPAQNTMRRLDLNTRQASMSRTGMPAEVLSESLLAQQFEVIGGAPERILAAGIMPVPEETRPTPDN